MTRKIVHLFRFETEIFQFFVQLQFVDKHPFTEKSSDQRGLKIGLSIGSQMNEVVPN